MTPPLMEGQVVVVTGAGQGIGREHALAFARAGAHVVVNDLGGAVDGTGGCESIADAVVAEITSAGGSAVASYDSVAIAEGAEAIIQKAIDAFGRIDVLVNNAGILRDKTLLKMTEAMWDAVIAVHLKGTYLCTQVAARVMREQGAGGRIINTSSSSGLEGNFGQSNYGAAKAGIFGFTRVTSMELARYQITVNAIAPVAYTRMTENLGGLVPPDLTPDKIAPLVVFLASPFAEHITGRTFGVQGNTIFEYRMEHSPSIHTSQPLWTPEGIAAAFPRLEREPEAPSPSEDSAAASLLGRLPEVFVPEAAGDWSATLRFVFHDAGTHTLRVADGVAHYTPGAEGTATCTIDFREAQVLLDLVAGKVSPQAAFMNGLMKADKMGDLMKFGTAFRLEALSESHPEPLEHTPQAGLNTELVGKVYRGDALFIEPEHTLAYAHATDDLNPRYIDSDRAEGLIAPPIFPVRLANDTVGQAVRDPELRVDMLNLVHGEQEMIYHDVLRPWDLIAPRTSVASIEHKRSGELLNLRTRLMRDGEAVVEILTGLFIRDRSAPKRAKAPAEPPPERTYIASETQTVAQDQPARYADASLDRNPIHLDPKVAEAAGLPSVILHGLCTMAFATRALVNHVCDGDPSRLARVRVRFSRVVLPGDELTTRIWREDEETVGFETLNGAGKSVLSGGRATIL